MRFSDSAPLLGLPSQRPFGMAGLGVSNGLMRYRAF